MLYLIRIILLFLILLFRFNSIAFDCKKAIYDSISLNIENIEPTQQFFDKIDSLPEGLRKDLYFRRIQKIGDNIFYEPSADWDTGQRLHAYLNFIMKHKDKIGDFDMVINLLDENRSYNVGIFNSKFYYDGPIFTFGYTDSDKKLFDGKSQFVLLPDPFFLSKEKYHQVVEKILNNKKELKVKQDFKYKYNYILFRGQLNIGAFDVYKETLWVHPRIKIFMMGMLFPDKIDAKLVGQSQLNKIVDERMRNLWEVTFYHDKEDPNNKRFMLSHLEQQQYKYILSLDGNGPSSTRPQLVSFGASSLLMYQTDYTQWFKAAMVPNFNYLPIKSDLSDLLQQYNWAQNNTEKVEEIIKNQETTALECFMPNEVENQFLFIMKEYSKKFRYKIKPKKNLTKMTNYLAHDTPK